METLKYITVATYLCIGAVVAVSLIKYAIRQHLAKPTQRWGEGARQVKSRA